MAYTQAQINAALLAGERHWSFRYDVVNPDGSVSGTAKVTAATINNDNLADQIKRTASFTIDYNAPINYNLQRLRPYARLLMPDGGWQEWPVGTFYLSTPKRTWRPYIQDGQLSYNPLTVDVAGYDGLQVLVDDAVTTRYVVAAGTAYTDAIRTVLTGAGFTNPLISASPLTLPAAREWEPGTSKQQIVNDLLASLNYTTLSMTPMGDPTARPYQPPEQVAPVWSYTIDRQSVVVPGVDVALDTFGVPNVWIATVSEPDAPVLTATASNDDPNSPLSTVSRNRHVVAIVDSANAADQTTLNALVAQAKAAASQQYEVATFKTGLMPFHDTDDVVLLDYGLGLLRYRSHTWSMELKAGGQMEHVVRRVVSV